MGALTSRKRLMGSGATAALLAAALAIAGACSTIVPLPESIQAATAHDGLDCSPLALIVVAGRAHGVGSGVLVHPRVVLTARHIVPAEPERLFAATPASRRGEAARIQRVVDGGGRPASTGDWALVVLDRPFQTIAARPAALPARAPRLRPGEPVWIARSPLTENGGGAMARNPLLIRTVCIERPAGAPVEAGVVFAPNPERRGYLGASGGPVLRASPPETPVLAGVYLGTGDRYLLGMPLDRELLLHTLPLDEIRRVVAEVESEESELAPAAGEQ